MAQSHEPECAFDLAMTKEKIFNKQQLEGFWMMAAKKHKGVVNCVTHREHWKTLMGIKRPYYHK